MKLIPFQGELIPFLCYIEKILGHKPQEDMDKKTPDIKPEKEEATCDKKEAKRKK